MEAAELLLRLWFAFCVVSAVVGRLSAWFVREGGSEGFLLRSEFSLSKIAVEFAFELVLSDGVDGIRLVFGVDEAGAIVDVANVVNS